MKKYNLSLNKSFQTAIWSGILALSAIIPGTVVEANDLPQQVYSKDVDDDYELALKLQNDFILAIENHDVEEFSSTISPIFQGLNGNNVFNRDQYIAILSQSEIDGFGIHDLIAYRHNNVLTVSYVLTTLNYKRSVSDFVVVSVWQKASGLHKDCHSSHHIPRHTWLLVSQNASPVAQP